ncbi:SAM-dependent methyltransferase [Tautonia plasticadhaerens]|uniref:Demethylrebeccamycin-D-glucose O-methyltransferase n=1 Tax=Tautonia plasticadhaerens TaxID=2527974 RepID=A0A518HCG6_9BACT|nr:methyltransferase domain-containing protein [Tautonia plasticadhaerens]QDV38554.1 Demethylrebeccamycin-D-glucose O-methyltransferase [Tautonia plasticadhaerens]
MRFASRVSVAGRSLWMVLLICCLCGPSPSAAARQEGAGEAQETRNPDVIYDPTPQPVVEAMLEAAGVKEGDVVYDLGCGDGRIVVTAARKYGVKAVGLDIDPKRVEEARANVEENGVGDLVTIRQADIFREDLSEASVVTLYLLPSLNVKLMPQLRKLKPGSRIVSHNFDMKGAKPKRIFSVEDERGPDRLVYLWVVPWEEEGTQPPPPEPEAPDDTAGGPGGPSPDRRR